MLVLTLAFIVVMVLTVLFPDLPPGALAALAAIDIGIWAAFLLKYLARLFDSPSRSAPGGVGSVPAVSSCS